MTFEYEKYGEKIKSFFRIFNSKTARTLIFVIIFIIGILLRIVGFSDLLVFKSDQARDALIMNQVKSGSFLDIPLLGPQVGGTLLRLGPITYYFQYISAKIFGFSPEGLAYPDLIFGILTIPLLFLLLRKFLSVALSLWTTALASSSLILVTFSRFGWNPNSLPFFTTLFAISFLYALESKGRKRWWYLGCAAICVGIVTQLHLAAILGLVLGLVIFLILLKELKWKEMLVCLIIVIIFNFPIILNEWRTQGNNTHELIVAIDKKGSKDEKHVIYEKFFRAYQENASVMWLIVTGQQNTDTILTRGLVFKCDKECKSALPYSIGAMVMLGYVIVSAYSRWKGERDLNKKRAIAFMGLWVCGFLFLSIPLAYQLETRFYLGIVAPLLFLIGLVVDGFMKINKNIPVKYFMVILGIFIIFINLYSTVMYLRELAISQSSAIDSSRDLRFGTAPKVTLGQLRAIASEANIQFDNNIPVIISGESLYVKSMYYALVVEYGLEGCYIRGDKDVSSQFNRLVIEYAPSEKALISFGTLSAMFIKSDSSVKVKRGSLPEECLTY